MKKIYILVLSMILTCSLNSYYYGKNKIQSEKTEWSVIETKHFDIHYKEGSDEFGKTCALIAEEGFYHLNKTFKQPLNTRIPIIIYENKQQFQTTNIIYPLLSEGVGGFTENMRNRVVVPFDGSYKKFEETLVHELTHAYINDINGMAFLNPFLNSGGSNLPFWLSEGLPEYLSIGGVDNYNNSFILDMVVNDYLRPMDEIYGYYAYRLGETFLSWLDIEYGKESVAKYFYQIRFSPDLDIATEKTYGMKFDELQEKFNIYLKRKYYPVINTHQLPYENSERVTNNKEFNAYMNFAPRFSPLEDQFVFYSNKDYQTSIWQGSTFKLKKNKKILQGESSSKFEEFHFQRSNISWFPDGQSFAFVSKTSFGDRIYIYNKQKGKLKKTIKIDELDSIYEIDVHPNGKEIVLSGQKNHQNNIYVYSLEKGNLTQITSDSYMESQVRWSHKGDKIAFTSERDLADSTKYNHVFNKLIQNIYYFDISSQTFHQVTFDKFNNYHPMWSTNDSTIVFISEKSTISNWECINIYEGKRGVITKNFSGVLDGDLSKTDSYLVYSCFFNGAWDIFLLHKPFINLVYEDYQPEKVIEFDDNFSTVFKLDRYQYYGKDDTLIKKSFKELMKESNYKDIQQKNRMDSLRYRYIDFYTTKSKEEEKPDSLNFKIPTIRDYKPKFKVDQFWGGLAYSSSVGTIGYLQFGISDLMGNHGFGINAQFNGKLKDSNLILSYMYLPYRTDYGLSLFNINDETIYYDGNTDDYYQAWENEIGSYILVRYPLSKFNRFDFENSLYQYSYKWSKWNYNTGDWDKDHEDKQFVYAPAISYVYDNALYGSTGPIQGIKSYHTLKKSFTKKEFEYATYYTDTRAYQMISERFSVASRFILGLSDGKNPELFNLESYNGVRGFEGTDSNNEQTADLKGRKKILTTLELRYPFIDNLKLGFPIPIQLSQIRGSIFTDIGTVWNKNKGFRGMSDGRLRDVKMGFGFGPRFNLGFVILKFDIAWETDLVNHGKPKYFFSLNEDF